MQDRWKDIWNKSVAGQGIHESVDIKSLLEMDGFNSSGHSVNAQEFIDFILSVSAESGVAEGDSIYEVGCGGGAILKIFQQYCKCSIIGGIDYSNTLIDVAKKQFPFSRFECGEASDLNLSKVATHVVSHSVFQYFPDDTYANNVLQKMLESAKRTLIVLDVPDVDSKEESIAARKEAIGAEKYDELYKNLHRKYYAKEFFREFCLKNHLAITFIEDRVRKDYMNAKYNFHLAMSLR